MVRNDVISETQGKQVPWEHSALTGRFYFNPSAQTASPPAPAAVPAQLSEAERAWAAAKDTKSIAVLEDFIARYRGTFYAGLAGGRIDELKKSQIGLVTPPAPSKGSQEKKPQGSRCPNIAGVWDSWSSGLFGKGDTTFNKDGAATHRSGIRGKWWCENGELRIEWSDGKPGPARLSADGKKIFNAQGEIHMSRD